MCGTTTKQTIYSPHNRAKRVTDKASGKWQMAMLLAHWQVKTAANSALPQDVYYINSLS